MILFAISTYKKLHALKRLLLKAWKGDTFEKENEEREMKSMRMIHLDKREREREEWN